MRLKWRSGLKRGLFHSRTVSRPEPVDRIPRFHRNAPRRLREILARCSFAFAYRIARDELIIIPVRSPFCPPHRRLMSPPCAPMPGTSNGMSPTILRTCASSSGKVAPTTNPH